MNDKREHIIEASIRLFAEKGYHVTSIQEIADSAGIAKGSLYSYFQSKEDLLLSIYRHYYERIDYRLASFDFRREMSPKERLIGKITALLAELVKSRDFFLMQMKEQTLANLQDTREYMHRMVSSTRMWYKEAVLDSFGEPILPYVRDCATILSGMISEYMKYYIFYRVELDPRQTAAFIVDRLDDVAEGMIRKQPPAVLASDAMKPVMCLIEPDSPSTASQIESELAAFRARLIHLDTDVAREALGALDVIQEELAKNRPNPLVLKGMAALLDQPDVPGAVTVCSMIEKLAAHMS